MQYFRSTAFDFMIVCFIIMLCLQINTADAKSRLECKDKSCKMSVDLNAHNPDGAHQGFRLRIERQGIQRKWSFILETGHVLIDTNRPVHWRVGNHEAVIFDTMKDFAAIDAPTQIHFLNTAKLSSLLQMGKNSSWRWSFIDIEGSPFDVEIDMSKIMPMLRDGQRYFGKRDDEILLGRLPEGVKLPPIDRMSSLSEISLSERVYKTHHILTQCEDLGLEDVAIHKLSDVAALYIFPCTKGSTNTSYALYVLDVGELGGITPLYFAHFSNSHGWSGRAILYNIKFDQTTKILTANPKSAGNGDCSYKGKWQWHKTAFKMLAYWAEKQCKGQTPQLIFEAD